MPPLPELQSRLRDAVVSGESSAVAPLLVGGAEPGKRLAIHRRHYGASLVGALMRKFPATTWLVGSALMENAAGAFVRLCPPTAPCIAEYGAGFPSFLAERDDARAFAYVRWFAELEWHLGHASIAVDQPAIGLSDLAPYGDQIAELALVAQSGLRYLASPWPIDEIMKHYLAETAPDEHRLSAENIWLEICGSRGAFRFDRLGHGEFRFREALAAGNALGAAAEQALEADDGLDIGAALRRFVTDRLAIGVRAQ